MQQGGGEAAARGVGTTPRKRLIGREKGLPINKYVIDIEDEDDVMW